MKKDISRRTFIKGAVAAAGVGPLIVPQLSFAAPPSGRLQHAAIGVGGQGAYDLGQINSSGKVDVVALCDIDEHTLREASKRYKGARLYRDWREMLEQEERNIDSVNVSTPDHTHAPASMTAIRKGKHVYCEKPLTHEVYETRRLTEAARKKGVATQMGIQIHSHDFYRTAVIWAREGALGKIKEWHAWSSASYSNDTKQRPPGTDPVPAHVDWDKWIGTAPERPFKTDEYHPFHWRVYRDFGGGATGDFGCHIMDSVFGALDLTAPNTISAQAESNSDDVHPAWVIADYEFPGTRMTTGKTIRGSWSDGGKKPDKHRSPHLPKDYELPPSGSMLVGEEGTMILPHYLMPELYPKAKYENYPVPELVTRNHYHEFVEASMGNTVAGANFDFAGPLTETVLLANVANRFPGETLQWDAQKLRFTNSPDATKLLKRRYRRGWKVRGLK